MSEIKETIDQLEKLKEHCKSIQSIDDCANYSEYIAAINTANSFLKKLEQDKGCKFCNDDLKYMSGELNIGFNDHAYTTECEQFRFCPMCGRNLIGGE